METGDGGSISPQFVDRWSGLLLGDMVRAVLADTTMACTLTPAEKSRSNGNFDGGVLHNWGKSYT